VKDGARHVGMADDVVGLVDELGGGEGADAEEDLVGGLDAAFGVGGRKEELLDLERAGLIDD